MGPVQGLNDYLQILRSPDIYPDIAGAGFIMSPIISVVSTIIAFLGMIALLFVLLRIGADVLIMSGAVSLMTGKAGAGVSSRLVGLSSFKDSDIAIYAGEPMKYVKDFAWKIVLMLAFIGLMISGHLLPLAGTVTAATGSIISKVSNINPVPYIEAIDLKADKITRSVERASLSTLMKEYNKHVSNMTAAKQQADKSESISETEHDQAAAAYYNSYHSARIYSYQLQTKLYELRNDDNKDRKLSREEEELRNFNYNAHEANKDNVLLAIGKANANDASKLYRGDPGLETKADDAKMALEALLRR